MRAAMKGRDAKGVAETGKAETEDNPVDEMHFHEVQIHIEIFGLPEP